MTLHLPEYNRLQEEAGGKPSLRGATITLHGMASRGVWQKDLATELFDAAIRCRALDFGFVLRARRSKLDSMADQVVSAYEEQLR